MPLFLLLLLGGILQAGSGNPLEGVLSKHKVQVSGPVSVEAGALPGSLVLEFQPSDDAGRVVVPLPADAADWTVFNTFEFRTEADTPVPWILQLRNAKGETFTYRVQPFPKVPVRATLPVHFLTRTYTNNRGFKGYALSNWANHIDVTSLQSISISMRTNRAARLEIGPLALHKEEIEDQLLIDSPKVDEFGQWTHISWPGKITSAEALRQAWAREDDSLKKHPDFDFCPYGGWKHKAVKATGFFHTVQQDGKWWLVDPDGHLFFSAGITCVRMRDQTRVAGREKLFAKLPPGTEVADFYNANAVLRYGEKSLFDNWSDQIERRFRAWGINTVANWSDPRLFSEPHLPFVTGVSIGRSVKNWQGYPDAYSAEFAQSAAQMAREQCWRFKDEKMLIGYFIGNEPHWQNRNLIDLILRDPDPSATQKFVKQFFAEKGDTRESRDLLMETLARRYFGTVTDAIKQADPNHLVLGIRWAGRAPDPVLRANDVFDVFSINIYRFEPPADQIAHIYSLVKKPILIGEYHFGSSERGYAPSLVMVKDQPERGVAYQRYLEAAAAQAPIVGVHYFQFKDQPVTGRFDGENYNIGFVDQLDLPYPELVRFAQAAHRRMYQVHAGEIPPVERVAKVR